MDADDRLVSDWRQHMLDEGAKKKNGAQEKRINRKCHAVFEFYLNVPEAMCLDVSFVSPAGPISSVEVNDRGGLFGRVRRSKPLRWMLNGPIGRSTVRRKTPDKALVLDVLEHLRNSATPDPRAPWRAELLNDRDWLIGRTMAEAGLRREEVSRLTTGAMDNALCAEPALAVLKRRFGNLCSVKAAADQAVILDALDVFEHRRHRKNIYVSVVGKGAGSGVLREVPFPVPLVRDLLIFGAWGVRRQQIERWAGKDPGYHAPDYFFLSEKTRGAFGSVAIGNRIKRAFTSVDSELSGQRLRAHFATTYAANLWHEKYAENGFRWDQAIENLVLEQVARALGHRRITTTVKHYLELAQMEYFDSPTKAELRTLRDGALVLKEAPKEVRDQAIKLIRRHSSLQGEKQLLLRQTIEGALAHPEFQVDASKCKKEESGAAAFSRVGLRVVPK